MLLTVFLAFLVMVAVAWLALAAAVLIGHPSRSSVREAARFMPHTMRFVWDLARDRNVPGRARWRLYVAFFYDVQPINIIPDFVPIIGVADNLIITAWALRSALRLAGPETVLAHWRGTDQELQTLYHLTRLGTPPPSPAQHL
jgi:uncharacterized membrane protein YkvA (DUF1232 family)